jgi:hypothetical protein
LRPGSENARVTPAARLVQCTSVTGGIPFADRAVDFEFTPPESGDATMSDPQPTPGHPKPPRAEPLQPDRPARGNDTESADVEAEEDAEAESVEQRKVQSETALSNVREGYGGPGS